MKIVCLVKVVPNVEDMHYSEETHTLVRDRSKQMLNPDDVAAVALALKLKAKHPKLEIELLTMGPQVVASVFRDLLRMGCDRATILSDKSFSGSDSFATSQVLATYIKAEAAALILSGTQALDGDTGHIPFQVAEWLGIPALAGITSLEEDSLFSMEGRVCCQEEEQILDFAIALPAVLGLSRESGYKLPYMRYEALQASVDERIFFLGAKDLGLSVDQVGSQGSLTKVEKTFVQAQGKGAHRILPCTPEGVEEVYQYLCKGRFV